MSCASPIASRSQSDTCLLPLSPEEWLQGSSAAINRVRVQILRAAPYFRVALVTGEPGSGGEAAARMLHKLSPVVHKPFFVLTSNDAHERIESDGSLDSLSSNGLLYLPHVEHASRTTQEALLSLMRKRGPHVLRIVASAGCKLGPMVHAGVFSSELANSLESLRITIPAIRDRKDDIPQLLSFIFEALARLSRVSPPALTIDLIESAMKRPWLGNLNELHAVAEVLMKRTPTDRLSAEDLDAVLGSNCCKTRITSLEAVVQQHICGVLLEAKGNKYQAARALGISRSTLYRMIKRKSVNLSAITPKAMS